MPHGLPRSRMVADLSQLPPIPVVECRTPGPGDTEALARLMLAAYRGSVDYEGEDEAQSLVEIGKTMAGEYGAFDGACSRVIDGDAGLVSAALLTRWRQRPFVAFSMTDPRFTRMGYARATLVSAMHALRAAGETELSLVVTLANEPAIALYRGLGFRLDGEVRMIRAPPMDG